MSQRTWHRLVVRPDSPIRYWATGQLQCAEAFREVIGDEPELEDVRAFSTHLFLSNGATHVESGELASFIEGLTAIARRRPNIFLELGQHFEAVGREWLSFCEQLAERELREQDDQSLARLFDEFIRRFTGYAPMLYLPFAVERRYSTEYPALFNKIVSQLANQAQQQLAETATTSLLRDLGLVRVENRPEELPETFRALLEYWPRRTMAEEKEQALLEIAAALEDQGGIRLTGPEDGMADALSDEDDSKLRAALEPFRWIGQWGYPPRYRPSSDEELLDELREKLARNPRTKLMERREQELKSPRDRVRLLGLLDLDEAERQLIDDIAYYNFLRTYRMEILIRAEFLSVALLREIEARLLERAKLERDEIFLLLPPEIQEVLSGRERPKDLVARHGEWALETQAIERRSHLASGPGYETFAGRFFSIIRKGENARGIYTAIDPTFSGGKAAGLFRLVEAGYNVPDFFVLTAQAFRQALDSDGLLADVANLSEQGEIERQSIQERVAKCRLHPAVLDEAQELCSGFQSWKVAVRSSASVEDGERRSWAGRFHTSLGVSAEGLPEAVSAVWSSLYGAEAWRYAAEAQTDLTAATMPVLVQCLVEGQWSGVMNTTFNLANRNLVEIEAVRGLGEELVGGTRTPLRYIIDAHPGPPAIVKRDIPASPAESEKDAEAPEAQMLQLATLGKALESAFGGPQDVEFTIRDGEIFLLQSRPLTDLQTPVAAGEAGVIPGEARLIGSGLKGKTATILRAKARVIREIDGGRQLQPGEVLILHAATPAWDAIIKRAAGLLTNEGGVTSHAVRVANEQHIPVVAGGGDFTERIPDGSEVIVDTRSDTFNGRVYLL